MALRWGSATETSRSNSGQEVVRGMFSIFQPLPPSLWCFILTLRCAAPDMKHGESVTFMSPATWVNIGSRANARARVSVMKCAPLCTHVRMWAHGRRAPRRKAVMAVEHTTPPRVTAASWLLRRHHPSQWNAAASVQRVTMWLPKSHSGGRGSLRHRRKQKKKGSVRNEMRSFFAWL